jgi:hypothetical protein
MIEICSTIFDTIQYLIRCWSRYGKRLANKALPSHSHHSPHSVLGISKLALDLFATNLPRLRSATKHYHSKRETTLEVHSS